MSKEKWNLELSEYIKQGEPEKQEKAKTWETAIGLQDVDGLKPSEYLLDTAKEHIEGNINIDEAKKRINSYYEQSNERNNEDNTEEADKVSVRIAEILSEKAFNFSPEPSSFSRWRRPTFLKALRAVSLSLFRSTTETFFIGSIICQPPVLHQL